MGWCVAADGQWCWTGWAQPGGVLCTWAMQTSPVRAYPRDRLTNKRVFLSTFLLAAWMHRTTPAL